MNTDKMRKNYGWGWYEECKNPELGDILVSINNKSTYTVIAMNGKRLTTICAWLGSVDGVANSSIIFIEPLPDVGYFTDFHLIGNILGAIKNTKDHFKEYSNRNDLNTYIGDK